LDFRTCPFRGRRGAPSACPGDGKRGNRQHFLKALAIVQARLLAAETPRRTARCSLCWCCISWATSPALHCTSLYSKDYPKGDYGGNAILIQYQAPPEAARLLGPRARREHGLARSEGAVGRGSGRARSGSARRSRRKCARRVSRRGRKRAWPWRAIVYLRGALRGWSRCRDRTATRREILARIPPLPPGYAEAAQECARRRLSWRLTAPPTC